MPQAIILFLILLSTALQLRGVYKDLTISSGVATFLMFIVIFWQAGFCAILHWGGFW